MKILIILRSSISDVVFASPLIRCLRLQLDEPSVYFLTSPGGMDVLQENPYLTNCFSDYSSLKASGLQFDYIFDLDATWSSLSFCITRKAKVFRFRGNEGVLWRLVRAFRRKTPPVHLTHAFLNLAAALGVKDDGLKLDYFIPAKDDLPIEWLPEQFRKDFVVFCISALWRTRKLPVKRMIELCDKVNKPIILIGSKDDIPLGAEVSIFFQRNESSAALEEGLSKLNKKALVFNGCGKFSLNQCASLIQQARYIISFDNEFIPIASAFSKTIISIWGNTVLDFGRYPYLTRFSVLENNRISCRPCSARGYQECPLKHFRCMNDIVFDLYV
jgi:ADP-heptose:LPS heptosyltransferase